MTDDGDRRLRLAAAVGWVLLALPLAVVLLSVGLSPDTNWTVRTAVAGFCILAIARPDDALLVTAAFVGFGTILAHLSGAPSLRVTEVLVAASVAGCCIDAVRRGPPFGRVPAGWISFPATLLAITAAASTAVWLRVDQFMTGYASAYLQRFLQSVSHDYFTKPGDFWVVVSTAVILEGLALFVVVAALCQRDRSFFARGLRMLIIGGAGLGLLSVVRLWEVLLRNPGGLETIRTFSAGLRISPQIPDYIAAGSYFSLCWVAALGLAVASPRGRYVWVGAGVPLIAALYLTGSRSVIAAALAGLAFLMFVVVRNRAASARGVVAFGVAAVVVMVLSYQWMIGRDVAGEMARQSLTVRSELVRTGLRVIATRPLFGVGIDRFFLVAGDFASPELRALWSGRLNPHNDFIRFGAELGMVGLVFFVWILAEAARRIWKALRSGRDARLAGLAGGLIAFLVTSMVSNPLMVREVSYAFWIALGLAVGHATRLLAHPESPDVISPPPVEPRGRYSRLRWPAAALVGSVLILSVPSRAAKELANVNVNRLSYGFFEWGLDPDGTPSRWSGRRATLFADGRARGVEISVSGAEVPSGIVQQVEIRLDGRLANRVTVAATRQQLHLIFPATQKSGPHRIDLSVSPTWVPAEVMPGNQDRRVLGVKVGEMKVIM